MNTLIGIVTYGNHEFTRLALREIRSTVESSYQIHVVIGKPGDHETRQEASRMGVWHSTLPEKNDGFPACLNDIMSLAWDRPGGTLETEVRNVIIMGNDVVPYPGAIDAMIRTAEETDFEWIAASQFDVQSLVSMYPEAAAAFTGKQFAFTDFSLRPWDVHAAAVRDCPPRLDTNPQGPALIKDVQNLCLYKRSVFDRLGYFDVNFWPNGYFSDNDYARRSVCAGLKSCALTHAQYFHFWSRTIHQGEPRPNHAYFDRNAAYYRKKWGGDFGRETADPAPLLFIPDRAGEEAAIRRWREA